MGVRIKPKRKQPRGANVKGTVKPIKDAIRHARPKPETMNAGLSTTEINRQLSNMRGAPNFHPGSGIGKERRETKRRLKKTRRLNKRIDRQMGD